MLGGQGNERRGGGIFYIFVWTIWLYMSCVSCYQSGKSEFKVLTPFPGFLQAQTKHGRSWERNWVFATNSEFLIPISLEPNVVNLWYFKLIIIWSNRIHSLKYLRSTTLESKDKVFKKAEFVAKTHLLLYSMFTTVNLFLCIFLLWDVCILESIVCDHMPFIVCCCPFLMSFFYIRVLSLLFGVLYLCSVFII